MKFKAETINHQWRNKYLYATGGASYSSGGGTNIDTSKYDEAYNIAKELSDWFYWNDDEDSVHCKYPLVGDSTVSCYGLGDAQGGGSGGTITIDGHAINEIAAGTNITIDIDGKKATINSLGGGGGTSYVAGDHIKISGNTISAYGFLTKESADTIYALSSDTRFHTHSNKETVLDKLTIKWWEEEQSYHLSFGQNNAKWTSATTWVDNAKDKVLSSVTYTKLTGTSVTDSATTKNNTLLISGHSHSNMDALSALTTTKMNQWDSAYTWYNTSAETINTGIENLNKWFYFDATNNAVRTPFNFIGDQTVSSYGIGDGQGGGGGGYITVDGRNINKLSRANHITFGGTGTELIIGDNIDLTAYLKTADADKKYLTKASADTLYLTSTDLNDYLKTSDADTRYIKTGDTRITNWDNNYTWYSTAKDKVLSAVTYTKQTGTSVTDSATTKNNTLLISGHSHSNMDALSGITTAKTSNWDKAYASAHTHSNKAELDKISDGDVAKWNSAYTWYNTSATTINSAVTDFRDYFYMSAGTLHTKYDFVGDQTVSSYGIGGSEGGGGGYISVSGRNINNISSANHITLGGTGANLIIGDNIDLTPYLKTTDADKKYLTQSSADARYALSSDTRFHTHDNKTVLDKLTQTVIDNSHTHSNKTVLDGITSAKITNWNNAHSWVNSNSATTEDTNKWVASAKTRVISAVTYTENTGASVSDSAKTSNNKILISGHSHTNKDAIDLFYLSGGVVHCSADFVGDKVVSSYGIGSSESGGGGYIKVDGKNITGLTKGDNIKFEFLNTNTNLKISAIQPDLTNYATTAYTESQYAKKDDIPTDYLTKTTADATYQAKGSYLSSTTKYLSAVTVGTTKYTATTTHNVTLPAYPTALKNPNALSWSGYNSGSYDGSAAKSFEIPSNISELNDDDEWGEAISKVKSSSGSWDDVASYFAKTGNTIYTKNKEGLSATTLSVPSLKMYSVEDSETGEEKTILKQTTDGDFLVQVEEAGTIILSGDTSIKSGLTVYQNANVYGTAQINKNLTVGQVATLASEDPKITLIGNTTIGIADTVVGTKITKGKPHNLTVNGDILATGECSCYSDIRLKSNIKQLEDRGTLHGYSYVKDGKQQLGVIAQQVQEAGYYEAVTENDNGYLSVNYNALIAVLIEKINNLEDVVEELKDKINQINN